MSGAGTVTEKDKKPCLGRHLITLKVKGQDVRKVYLMIERSSPLKKLMNDYCDRLSIDYNSRVFLLDGVRIRDQQTADELGMEDGDVIDAFSHAIGGSVINYAHQYNISIHSYQNFRRS